VTGLVDKDGCQGFKKVGLHVHEIEKAVWRQESGVSGATCRRSWKGREAAHAAMNRRTTSWRSTELLVEHQSCISSASRGALSVLDASYKFCRTSDASPAVPCGQSREPLLASCSCQMFLVNCREQIVMCSGASGAGLGFAIQFCDQRQVSSAARILERTRFCSTNGLFVPVTMLSSLAVVLDEEGGDEDPSSSRGSH